MKSNEQHVDASMSKINIIKSIDSQFLSSFAHLTKSEKTERIDGALSLLKHLNENRNKDAGDEEKRAYERTYTLQRLVRGLGASTADSRTGFYSTLVALLSSTPDDEYPSIDDVFNSVSTQLKISKKNGCMDKEDSDALIGRILACGALLRSNKLSNVSTDQLKKYVEILVEASHHKFFHSSLAYTFLLELLEKQSADQFEKAVWPAVRKQLKRPWERHDINTIQFLIETHTKYPHLVDEELFANGLQSSDILEPSSFKYFGRLFWSPASNMIAATHPAYETFGKFLGETVSTTTLHKFWQNEVNALLLAPSKVKEVVTIRLLTIIFNLKEISGETAIVLLSKQFVALLTKSLKNIGQRKDEFMQALYEEFFNSIENYLKSLSTDDDDKVKVAVIKGFICRPGTLLIEKYSSNRIIHKIIGTLSAPGIAALFDFYKNVLLDLVPKDAKDPTEKWLLMEREHSLHMMQTLLKQKAVHGQQKWLTEQLQLMLKLGLFFVDKQTQAVIPRRNLDALPYEPAQIKQAFYSSLGIKFHRLEDEYNMLVSLVQFCNAELSKSANKCLRHPLSEKALQAWHKMFEKVTQKPKKKGSKLHIVFNLLLLHMGLQLFVDPNMAQLAIDDLEKCMERIQQKSKVNSDNEPEWIEVVVDLFLHLLSHNASFLRSIVDKVFPHLCNSLNLTAIHQILAMLNLKEENPLSNGTENHSDDEDDNSEDSEEDDENEDDEDDDDDDDNVAVDADNDMEIDEESSSDEDDKEMEDEREGAPDQLRSAISQALGMTTTETDNESVDLNDMTEADAERLDAALSNAFKLIAKKGSGGSKKKTKRERITQTTVMHFRTRVLDLIEIYLKTSPSLMVTLEILPALLTMTGHCKSNKDLAPLSKRLNRVLHILLNLREFASVDDVTEENLVQLLDSLFGMEVNGSSLEEHNQLLAQCCSFLVAASQRLQSPSNTSTLFNFLKETLQKFLKTRNPRIPQNCFSTIMKLHWTGVWRLGQTLVESGLLANNEVRGFRRVQAIEFLSILYKNNGFIKQHSKEFNAANKKLQQGIVKYIQWLDSSDSILPKEFQALVILLDNVFCCETASGTNWDEIKERLQSVRRKTTVLSMPKYNLLCKRLSIQPIKNDEVNVQKNKTNSTNGVHNGSETKSPVQGEKKVKRKADNQENGATKLNSKKLKKMRKEERLKLASAGLEEDVTFNLNGTHVDAADSSSSE